MSSSLNQVHLIGNITKAVELKKTNNDQSVCSFGLATNRSWTNKTTGEKQQQAEFHSIVAWGKLAEIIAQYTHKGSKVYIGGRLATRKWEKDGVTRERTEIIADNMSMLDRKQDAPNTENNADMGGVGAAEAQTEEVEMIDLPF